MPSWFKKVFKENEAVSERVATAGAAGLSASATVIPESDEAPVENERPRIRIRTLVNAPVIVPEEEQSSWSEEIRIKARVEADGFTCTFMVDRPVLEGLSAWFPEAKWSAGISPLAEKLFEVDGVGTVLLHDTTVTIGRSNTNKREWEEVAKDIGAALRDHLKQEKQVVSDAFLDGIPVEEEIRKKIQSCLDIEINPGIEAHSGVITLERVTGNTAYITMGGGCQGCAASTITLRQGIHTAFRRAVPELGGIFDETDHTSGTNPYFKELPAGMSEAGN